MSHQGLIDSKWLYQASELLKLLMLAVHVKIIECGLGFDIRDSNAGKNSEQMKKKIIKFVEIEEMISWTGQCQKELGALRGT